jgi:hypothetical protein
VGVWMLLCSNGDIAVLDICLCGPVLFFIFMNMCIYCVGGVCAVVAFCNLTSENTRIYLVVLILSHILLQQNLLCISS